MLIITFEGNIGAGKTSLLSELENVQFDAPHIVVYEPVDDWMNKRTRPGEKSLFELFYEDKKRYGFAFQMYALKSRFKHFMELIRTHPNKIILCERCPMTDCNIFAKLLRDDGLISEHEFMVYESWYNFAMETINTRISGIVYLNVEPRICVQRIMKRNRKGEVNMDEVYVNRLHSQHEAWLSGREDILRLDGNGDECDIDAIVRYVNGIVQVGLGVGGLKQ